jgi:hypothetical protein
MEAHEAFERFEKTHEASHGDGGHEGGADKLSRQAALTVAVVAAFLAVATFLGTESQKDAIQGQTKAAVAEGDQTTFDTQKLVFDSDQLLLLALAQSGDSQLAHAAKGETTALTSAASDKTIAAEKKKRSDEVAKNNHEVSHANDQHLLYEISEVLLQIAIVLASVSIIARRRALLLGSGSLAAIGVVVLVVGIAV